MSDWIDITTVGSSYEVQYSPQTSGYRWRHSSFQMPSELGDFGSAAVGEWQYGPPPKE